MFVFWCNEKKIQQKQHEKKTKDLLGKISVFRLLLRFDFLFFSPYNKTIEYQKTNILLYCSKEFTFILDGDSDVWLDLPHIIIMRQFFRLLSIC